jgi:hypothetical protein
METVEFITTESGDDLIVSFAIAGRTDPVDVISLTLLRTPKFEFILEPEERGFSISHEDILDDEDMLESIRWEGTTVRIVTRAGRRYVLDVRRVSDDDARQAKEVLAAMNADHAFKMEIVGQGVRRDR